MLTDRRLTDLVAIASSLKGRGVLVDLDKEVIIEIGELLEVLQEAQCFRAPPPGETVGRYAGLKASLKGLPDTWYPDLIATLIQEAMGRPIFKDGDPVPFVTVIRDTVRRKKRGS